MGNIKHVGQGDWQELVTSPKPVLVDFWAGWCAPCRMMAPAFEKLASEYGDRVSFAKVDVDELPELAGQYGIRSIPTLLLLREGRVVDELIGARPYPDLARFLEQHLGASEGSPPRLVRLAK